MARITSLESGTAPRRLNHVLFPDPGSPIANTTTPLGCLGCAGRAAACSCLPAALASNGPAADDPAVSAASPYAGCSGAAWLPAAAPRPPLPRRPLRRRRLLPERCPSPGFPSPSAPLLAPALSPGFSAASSVPLGPASSAPCPSLLAPDALSAGFLSTSPRSFAPPARAASVSGSLLASSLVMKFGCSGGGASPAFALLPPFFLRRRIRSRIHLLISRLVTHPSLWGQCALLSLACHNPA